MIEYTPEDGIFTLDFGSGYSPASPPFTPGGAQQVEVAGQVYSLTLPLLNASGSVLQRAIPASRAQRRPPGGAAALGRACPERSEGFHARQMTAG
jgi:hypothetical protein